MTAPASTPPPNAPSPVESSAPRIPVPHPEGRRSFERLVVFLAILFAFTMAFMLYNSWRRTATNVGDGRDVNSYGFDLSNFTGDRAALVTSGRSKDFLPRVPPLQVVDADAMHLLKETGPKAVTPAVLAAQADRTFKGWRRLVVSDDIVIGVVVSGESRAYPLRYIQWHEIINDRLGDQPITVTYSIMSDTAAVFSPRIGERVHLFGFSGLLYSGNLVMYDIQPDGDEQAIRAEARAAGKPIDGRTLRALASSAGESLWSQALMAPIAGPALGAGAKLTPLPMWLGRWGDWLELHPDSTVFAGDRAAADAYKIRPENLPWQTGRIDLPLAGSPSPLPPDVAIQPLWISSTGPAAAPVAHPAANDQPPPPDLIMTTHRYLWNALHPASNTP